MASVMIGRTACPECGFEGAHVKKSDKCTYRYCPECGAQHHAKTQRQVVDLMGKTRLTAATAEPTPTEPEKTPPAASLEVLPTPTEPSPTPTPAQRRRLF